MASQPTQRVVSYYTASRRQLDQFRRRSQIKERPKRMYHWQLLHDWWFIMLAGLVLAISAVYVVTLDSKALVKISGLSFRPIPTYQQLVASQMQKSVLNRFKPFLNKNDIKNQLLRQIPEAQNISVSTTLIGHKPVVNITTYNILAVMIQDNQNDTLISTRGKVLINVNNSNLKTNDLPLIQNKTGITVKEGEQFMHPDEAKALYRLVQQFVASKSTATFTLTSVPHEIMAKEVGRGYEVKFLLNDTVVTQFGAMRATQAKLLAINQKPSAYLDVRLSDKVYYR